MDRYISDSSFLTSRFNLNTATSVWLFVSQDLCTSVQSAWCTYPDCLFVFDSILSSLFLQRRDPFGSLFFSCHSLNDVPNRSPRAPVYCKHCRKLHKPLQRFTAKFRSAMSNPWSLCHCCQTGIHCCTAHNASCSAWADKVSFAQRILPLTFCFANILSSGFQLLFRKTFCW